MIEFQFRFTRYSKSKGRLRLSGWTTAHGLSFGDAVKVAEAMLTGMQSADPTHSYLIHAVEHKGCHFNDGEGQSYTGTGIWETDAEFQERVSKKKG